MTNKYLALLEKFEGTAEWTALGRGLAMDFDTPAKIHISRFCAFAGITLREYDSMMLTRAARNSN
jgi:hypothetical protein